MKIIGIIPARYASTRFPGKPLVDIQGKSMIQRVYEQCIKADKLSSVLIATDDQRIYDHVISFGGKAWMTSHEHQSGTDRCAEIIESGKAGDWDAVINIQGDEPYIHPEQINLLCEVMQEKSVAIGTLVKKIDAQSELFNHNNVKVVLNNKLDAIYFSRSPIPFNRNFPEDEWLKHSTYYKHIGIYGYKTKTLLEISKLAKTNLEITESLEQLRWIENGYQIKAAVTHLESVSIDTPDDLLKINE
ncbi:MAG: 3-deoxy-manno-octulosonate cytidylyltransferase [Bacteroidia bacterium]|jgi:3-deoxy-manno-octulosonate cytidylyltransferase (CMP-KDO synthetase)|nr:3-deoxy-manno-octulosonate cytidylyltransferase [Bacteroidota bacterium]MBP9790210.1 3-deoxy-manno-octulosonate cytidylyltransferase [Bacteroidia bacterium]MBP9922581.1 3-deoxy-manno-octulosonate cytidylyltransferase [Bacteroidia bacterium]HQW00371.1 3-deoxy-manno-octulosonate cytidylyltransferase [Bacteroidia bacterium]